MTDTVASVLAPRPSDNPLPRRQLRPGRTRGHRVRPSGDRRDPGRARGALVAQRPEPRPRQRPCGPPLVHGHGHGARGPAPRRPGRVVPQPVRRRRRAGSRPTPTSAASPARRGRWSKRARRRSSSSYELDSLGVNRFFGTLPNGFSAHPKYDPATGELHAMAYHWPDLVDHVQYVVVGPDGRVSKVTDIPVPDMPMMHDMSLTPTYAVVYDLPVTVNLDVMVEGYPWPFAWAPDRAARVGLLPRSGTADDIIWCDVDPCYVFHPLNAYDADDGTVVVDLCRYERMMENDRRGPFGDSLPTFDRWVIDPDGEARHRDPARRPPAGVPAPRPRRRVAAPSLRLHLRGHPGGSEPPRCDPEARRRLRHDRIARVRSRPRRRRAGRRAQGRRRRRGRLPGSSPSSTTPPPTPANCASSTRRTSPDPRSHGSISPSACRSDSTATGSPTPRSLLRRDRHRSRELVPELFAHEFTRTAERRDHLADGPSIGQPRKVSPR